MNLKFNVNQKHFNTIVIESFLDVIKYNHNNNNKNIDYKNQYIKKFIVLTIIIGRN